MKYIISILAFMLASHSSAYAALGRTIQQTPGGGQATGKSEESSGWIFSGLGDSMWGAFDNFTNVALQVIWVLIVGFIIYKTVRLLFELYYSKNLRYLQITLPRADSKLDKEKETKKDFKEKIARAGIRMMRSNILYCDIWKLCKPCITTYNIYL